MLRSLLAFLTETIEQDNNVSIIKYKGDSVSNKDKM